MTLTDHRESLEAVASLTDDADVRLCVEKGTYTLPLNGMVIDEQDADLSGNGIHCFSHTPRAGHEHSLRKHSLHPTRSPVFHTIRF